MQNDAQCVKVVFNFFSPFKSSKLIIPCDNRARAKFLLHYFRSLDSPHEECKVAGIYESYVHTIRVCSQYKLIYARSQLCTRADGIRVGGAEGGERGMIVHYINTPQRDGTLVRSVANGSAPISIAIDALGPDRFNLRVGGQLFADTRVK